MVYIPHVTTGELAHADKSKTENRRAGSSVLMSFDGMAPLVVVLDMEGYTGG